METTPILGHRDLKIERHKPPLDNSALTQLLMELIVLAGFQVTSVGVICQRETQLLYTTLPC